jgi:hypothetical protein
MTPFGSLVAGSLADVVGVAVTLTLGGIACVTGAIYLARKRPQLREHIRPIYARLGILRQ